MRATIAGLAHEETPQLRPVAAGSPAACSVPDDVPSSREPDWTVKALATVCAAAVGSAIGLFGSSQAAMPWALLVGLAFVGGLLSTWSPCGYSSLSTLRPWGRWSPRAVVGWLPALAAHAAGYVLGGIVLSGLLAGLALVVGLSSNSPQALIAVAALALVYGLDQLGLISLPYPQRKSQVPHDVRLRWPMWRIGLLYGFALGLNFVTYVRTPILYVVVAAAVLSGSWEIAFALVAALNLGRFSPVLVNAFPVSDPSVQRWLAERESASLLAGAVALVLVATALFAAALVR